MCGIAGIIALDGRPLDDDRSRGLVEGMLDRMAHRGPDGRGLVGEPGLILGHLRLAILDPTPAGHQPMRRADRWLIHNGEVYDYLELADDLRRLGHTFATQTDTEVMLAAYETWGPEAVTRFDGMWAFALWDGPRRRLLLSRDRLGVKPLYLRRTGRTLAFASEPAALVHARPLDDGDGWSPEPDPAVTRDFLVEGLVDHSERTFWAGIEALPAAHSVLVDVDQGSVRRIRHWGPPILTDDLRQTVKGVDAERDREAIARFRELFDHSVRLRLRSDVPLGTCLSGGLDSSAIVGSIASALATPSDPGIDASAHEQLPQFAFHARFPEHGIDESHYAEAVAARSGVELVYADAPSSPILETIARTLRIQGEPFAGPSIVAQEEVMRAVHRAGLKVLLDGQGADELLAGYHVYLGIRTAALATSGRWAGGLDEVQGQVRSGTVGSKAAGVGMARALSGGRAGAAWRRVRGRPDALVVEPVLAGEASLLAPEAVPGTQLARRLWQDTTVTGLPAMLRYEDRNSMAVGIEARVPFLDVHLVEHVVGLPDRLKVRRGTTKILLRRGLADRLPPEVLARRDKIGFVAPEAAWLTDGRDAVAELLADGQLVRRGWVHASEIDRALGKVGGARRQTVLAWRLAIMKSWLRLGWPDLASTTPAWTAAESAVPVAGVDGRLD